MQCNSGKGEMWEILMVRNMKSLSEKSKSSDLVQLAKSSRAIHGGAYFSAVCGRKLIPINAPEPYECQECNRLLFFPPPPTFVSSPTVSHSFLCFMGNFEWICSKTANMDFSSTQFCISFVILHECFMPSYCKPTVLVRLFFPTQCKFSRGLAPKRLIWISH